MWQEALACMAQRRVALCIPGANGPIELVYWYGVLASVGIFLGAFYASKHLELEGEDPDLVWDALLWVLVPALLGGRLWYVAQAVLLDGSTAYSLSRPLEILNPRLGGLHIQGATVAGIIATMVYVRVKKVNGWLMADAALMGLLIGQGIGRIGNFINQELYGPPTGSSWFGMLIPLESRTDFPNLPADTRFHPTMFYEAFWLFLVFAVLYYIFRRYQERMIQGVLTGAYFVLAGFGRFIIEFWRPDQPLLPFPQVHISLSRLVAMVYVLVGLIIVLDRLGYLRIPFIRRPQTRRQRERAYQEMLVERRRRERTRERARQREARRKAREQAAKNAEETEANP